MESTNLNSARNERLFPSTSSTSASGRAEERQDEDNEKTENEPNVDDHPSVNKQQMILTCMDNPSFIAYFKYPEIIHLIRKGNTDVVVPDIGDVLEEELHKQKELIIKRLSEINYNVSVCLFKFSMNNSHYILIMLISTNDLKIIPTFMLDCFKIRTLQFPALGQIICEKLENFHISNRTTEIVIGNAELTPLRTILCERLGIKLDRSEELEK